MNKTVNLKPEETQGNVKLRKVYTNNLGPGKKCKYMSDTPPKYKYFKPDTSLDSPSDTPFDITPDNPNRCRYIK